MPNNPAAKQGELRDIADRWGYELRADGRWRHITDRDFVISRGLTDDELMAKQGGRTTP